MHHSRRVKANQGGHSGNASTTPTIGTQPRRNGFPTRIGDRATHDGFRRPNSEPSSSPLLTGPLSGAVGPFAGRFRSRGRAGTPSGSTRSTRSGNEQHG